MLTPRELSPLTHTHNAGQVQAWLQFPHNTNRSYGNVSVACAPATPNPPKFRAKFESRARHPLRDLGWWDELVAGLAATAPPTARPAPQPASPRTVHRWHSPPFGCPAPCVCEDKWSDPPLTTTPSCSLYRLAQFEQLCMNAMSAGRQRSPAQPARELSFRANLLFRAQTTRCATRLRRCSSRVSGKEG